MPPVVLLVAITPAAPIDRRRLEDALQALAAEDGDLEIRAGAGQGSAVIGAIGESHLEVILDRLHREFGVEADLGRIRVACLETVTRAADGSAKLARTDRGQPEYGHVVLRVRPGEPGSGHTVNDTTLDGTIPKQFLPAVESGIRQALENGTRGYPMIDVSVDVHDGSYHDVDSTEAIFRTAAALAFADAARKAGPIVLEPVMEIVVTAEMRDVPAALAALRARGAELHTRRDGPHGETIAAQAPLRDLFGLEAELRADTQGRAACAIHFAGYRPASHGAAGDDRDSHVGAPRRPVPNPRSMRASVPEPDESDHAR